MGRKLLAYEDAAKLLGGESRTITALSKIAGAALVGLSVGGAPAAAGFFELKDEIISLGQLAVTELRKRLTGLNRFKRSELLESAHAVLVVSAFFSALDDLDAELCSTLNSASLELTKAEQVVLATQSHLPGKDGLADLARNLIAPGTIPGISITITGAERDLHVYYRDLANRVRNFAIGTATWDRRDETTRERWSNTVTEVLPQCAITHYEEQLARLSGEFPEFAFIAHRVGVRQILNELRAARSDTAELQTILRGGAGLLAIAARGKEPDTIRTDLVSQYRDQVIKPLAGAAQATTPEEVSLPALCDLYVNPSYRTLPLDPRTEAIERITETGWEAVRPQDDLEAMVLEHLLSTDATRGPLMLLGQPGAGKSVFTQMLAAELDPRDFLVVRVELRAVPSDAGVQEQIEAALASLTGRSVPWPDLAEAAGDAQPVIILDGFDELLQASGVSHFDFLERVQAFQDRESGLHRPVAVLVTSRTAVANQVRYPSGTFVVRLEAFNEKQVTSWLAVWNRANPTRPLISEVALSQGELARQPLLLFLLALFHSGGGNLTSEISQARLFERLFNSFVERDVAKLDANIADSERQRTVQRDLDNLSMVAFAMFNRGRQSVTDADLVADLSALQAESTTLSGALGRAAALSTADRMAGRFFFRLFIHRDQAIRGHHSTLSTYEFLHASFAEFLIARWIVDELSRLGEHVRRVANDPYPQPPDDSKLHALLSVTVLSTREQRVLDFTAELLMQKPDDELSELHTLTSSIIHGCLQPRRHNPYPNYQPAVMTAPAADAAYSANLILLLVVITEANAPVAPDLNHAGAPISDLRLPGTGKAEAGTGLDGFHNVARLWNSQLTPAEWASLVDAVRIRQLDSTETSAAGEDSRYEISRWREEDRIDPALGRQILLYGSDQVVLPPDVCVEFESNSGYVIREAALLGISGYQGACVALLPYVDAFDPGASSTFDECGTTASMISIFLPSPYMTGERRVAIYKSLLTNAPSVYPSRVLWDNFSSQIEHLPELEAIQAVRAAGARAWTHITAYMDILAYFNNLKRRQRMPEVLNRELDLLLENIDSAIFFDSAYYQPDNVPELFDLLKIQSIMFRSGIRGYTLAYSMELSAELSMLLCLRDLLGQSDLSKLINIDSDPDPNFPKQYDAQGSAESGLALSERCDVQDWVESGQVFRDTRSILQIVFWAGMASRGLPVRQPSFIATAEDVAILASIAPDIVAQIQQLATEHGFRDPFNEP